MSNDKYKGKGGSYVRLPDGTRIPAAEAAKRSAYKVKPVESKPVEVKAAEKKDAEK